MLFKQLLFFLVETASLKQHFKNLFFSIEILSQLKLIIGFCPNISKGPPLIRDRQEPHFCSSLYGSWMNHKPNHTLVCKPNQFLLVREPFKPPLLARCGFGSKQKAGGEMAGRQSSLYTVKSCRANPTL